MTAPKEAFKYLSNFPFSPLTTAKCHNVFQYVLSLFVWRDRLPEGGFLLFLLPLADILCLAIAGVSLWFTVQKFYWKKLEIGMNATAIIVSFLSFIDVIYHSQLDATFTVIHLFCLISWVFCIWWSFTKTSNTVSNLFIANWGQATSDIEIEALEDHF